MYNNSLIDLNFKVTATLKEASITETLDKVLFGSNISFKIIDNQITLFPVEFNQQKDRAKKGSYSGVIMDGDNHPVIGAGVTVKGSKIGAATDLDGKFLLNYDTEPVTLVISSIGYKTKEIKVAKYSNNIYVALETDVDMLEELVVIGYGTQKKLTLTGSAASTSGQALQKNSSVNLSQGLAGRLSGVIVNNRSGEPGNDDAIMFIRGRSTLGDNSPLIIIDGIAGRSEEFGRLTGDEIESVTVLKDASAAIYGSRSANGVILVTTKRGVNNSAPKIDFTYDLGLQQPTRLVEMADAVLYTTSYNASRAIDGDSPIYSAEDIQKYKDGSDPILYPNTNWYNEMIKPLSQQHKYGVTLRGGTDRIAYFVSVNGQFQDGIFKKSATNYSQYNLRSNVDAKVTSWLKVGADISVRQQNKNYSAFPSDDYGIFYVTQRRLPTGAAYYPNGYLRGGTNPAIMVQEATGYDKRKIYSINTTFSAQIDLGKVIKGLTVDGHVAYDINNTFRKNWQCPWSYYSYDEVSGSYEEHTSSYWPTATLREYYSTWNNLTINAMLNYNRTFAEKHNVSFMAGFEQNSYRYDTFSASRLKYSSDAIDELFAGDADKSYFGNTGSARETARRSFFGRLNYDYANKYMVSVIARYDGSENFPKENRWGFFPGVSAGWVLSEENFIKDNSDHLTYLKLRASYGEQGNDAINPFQYLTTYGYSTSTTYKQMMGNADVNIVIPGTVPNPYVTWEVARTWNVGIDGAIDKNLFTWEVEVFKTRRSNILCKRNASIPNYSGLTNLPDENIGIVDNKGIELQLGHQKIVSGKFSYNLQANFMYAKNTIIYMDEAPWGEGYDYMKLEGKPMGAQLYYQVIGINKTEDDLKNYPQLSGASLGDFIYQDVDGNGKINSKDRVRGDLTAVPQIVFGLNASFTYSDFDLTFLLQGQARARYYYSPLKDPISSNLDANAARNAWTLDNTSSDYPRIGSTNSNGGVYRNTFYYSNSSFLRLKNIELGYSLPYNFLKKIGVTAARIYLGGYNLFTIDKLKVVDPETSDEENQTYPQVKVFNLGIKLTF